MATNIPEKRTFPCEPATIEKISNALWYAAKSNGKNIAALRHSTHPIQPDRISWTELRFLGILGREESTCNTELEKAGMNPGFYISCQGDALILIHQDAGHIQRYVDLCGEKPEILGIYNTSLSSLNISSLANLRELQVAGNKAFSTLEGLEQLTQLTCLNLCSCRQTPDLSAVAALPQLTNLLIQHCDTLINFPSLPELTQLKSLTLRKFSEPNILAHLGKLTQLDALHISSCNNLTALPGLENLTQLTSLELSGCEKLTALSGLENMPQLTSLNLSWCEKLTALPGLECLTQLTSLNLSGCSSLTALPGLENMTQLTSLNLSWCEKLTALPGLENMTQLTFLNLSWCEKLTVLPESIYKLPALRSLDLGHMHLRDLPDWFPEIAEQFYLEETDFGALSQARFHNSDVKKAIVCLAGTTAENVDMAVFQQPYEMVVRWFEERKAGRTRPLNEIKVVFLGDGEAGKSHTIARLMNDGGDPVDYVDSSTPGIVIKDRNYTVDDRTFRVHYWDFGGQEIMHSMHRIFLTGRTMYVVLLNARDDTQGDRAHYWLHNIQSFAPGAPVLLVLNKIDQNPKASVDERTLRSRYPGLTQIVRLSALEFDQEDFNKAFTNVLLNEIRKTGYLDAQWPGAWIQVKERLEKMESHYIWGDDYQDICRECQVDSNQENLLLWFNDLGVSFCCRDENDYALEDYVILRPDWITNALYIILFNRLQEAENGLIPLRSIYGILKNACNNPAIHCTLPTARYNSGDIQYVLGIMRKFSLSFPHGTDHEFIPMLCQQGSMVDIQKCHENSSILEFRMDFDYLPNNLLHRLMVERHSELDMDKVWRTGARFQLPELGLSAVVVIDGSTLRFFISHKNTLYRPNTYLTMLKTNVDRIVAKMNLKPPTCQLIYKLDGKCEEFEFGLLNEMLDAGETTVFSRIQRKSIPIANILNQSAPDGLEDEMKLLDAIRRSCQNIQGEPDYYLKGDGHGMEDKRNRRLRDDLYGWGYHIQDQTQRGRSGSEKSIGELDFLLHNDKRELWTAIEALRVSDGTTAEWKKHLNKLIGNYNFFGARFLYLLTYVDTDDKSFARIWKDYQRKIPKYNPGPYMYSSEALTDLSNADHQNIKTARCRYTCGGDPITVYHIFARIPTQNG